MTTPTTRRTMDDDVAFTEEHTDGITTIRGTVFLGIGMISLEPTEGPLHQMSIRVTPVMLERLANMCDQMRYELLEATGKDIAA